MVIGLVSDSYYPSVDGVFNVVHHLACALQDYAEVYVIVPRPAKLEACTSFYSKLPYKVLFCSCRRIAAQGYAIADPKHDGIFQRELGNIPFDVFHTNSVFALSNYLLGYAKQRGIPVTNTIHSQFVPDLKRYLKFDWIVHLVVKSMVLKLNHYDLVFTLNESMDALARRNGVISPTVILRNATHFHYPENDRDLREWARQKYALRSRNVILFVGRLIRQKGIFFILDCLSVLAGRGIDFHMLFVGSGIDERRLRRRISQLGLEDRVTLCGRLTEQREISSLYLSASLLLLPSYYDTDGLVIKEAAAHKVPSLLITDSITACNIIEGENGYLAPYDVLQYAATIEGILADERRCQVGEAAYGTMYRHWDDVAKEVLQHYDRLKRR